MYKFTDSGKEILLEVSNRNTACFKSNIFGGGSHSSLSITYAICENHLAGMYPMLIDPTGRDRAEVFHAIPRFQWPLTDSAVYVHSLFILLLMPSPQVSSKGKPDGITSQGRILLFYSQNPESNTHTHTHTHIHFCLFFTEVLILKVSQC